MKSFIIIFISCSLLGSCHRYNAKYIKPIKNKAGKQSIYLSNYKVNLEFYGDYLFHPLKASQTPNFQREFNKSIRLNCNSALVFSAHTIIKPYCTVYGIWYEKSNRDSITNKLMNVLKSSGNAENLNAQIKQVGKVYFSICSYDLYNSKYNYFVHYTDYISEQGPDTYRITFSTTESNLEWFQNECEGIINSMEFR